jgi:hypothetical protein
LPLPLPFSSSSSLIFFLVLPFVNSSYGSSH